MKSIKYFYLLIICLVLAISCRKDSIVVTEKDIVLPDTENVSFQFLVSTESREPISDAQIMIESDVYTSNENGTVITQPYKVSSIGLKAEIVAPGFESSVRLLIGPKDSRVREEVILFKTLNTVIAAGNSGVIDGSGKLSLPPTLQDKDGSAYSGPVFVKSKYLDPDNKDFLLSAPGNLLALNTSDEYQQLASLGMYMIELNDAEGDELTIPNGSSAIIEFPIADKHKDVIGSEIPLWYFDEDSGVWKEDGVARVDGEVMIAEVGHFTWWNCDLPYDFEVVCMVFLDHNGEILPGLEIEFSVNGVSFGLATTDAYGALIAKIPIGEIIDVTFYLDGVAIGSQSINPFPESNDKIVVNTDLNLIKISGKTLGCDTNPVTNGYGYYEGISGLEILTFAQDGSFSYYAPGIEHELILVDISTNKIKKIDISEAEQNEDLDLDFIVICLEEVSTKVSGYLMIDTNKDNEGDIPLSAANISIINTDNLMTDIVQSNANGYYEMDLLPGIIYELRVSTLEPYTLIAAGDKTPDGDVDNNEFDFGNREGNAMVLQDEHDSDNDFLFTPEGTGTISGIAMADTDEDGIADTPLEWFNILLNNPPGSSNVSVAADGTFSANVAAGYYTVFAVEFLFGDYEMLVSWDTSVDPDGDDSTLGPGYDFSMPVVLHHDEVDADNTFIVDHSNKKSLLCQVLEDTNFDGEGDTPIEGFNLEMKTRATGQTISQRRTDEFGVVFFPVGDTFSEITVTTINAAYDVIDLVDTSTDDNDPFIIDGDITKMEINMEVGEWDAGNIFVVRKN